jgi:protein-disulfide isomerase
LAAAKQAHFADFNARLLADKTPEHQLTEAHIFDIARDSGIDVDRLKSDMASPTIDQQIADTKALATKLGINGTPGIVIGGEMVPGNVTFDQLVSIVNHARHAITARSPS